MDASLNIAFINFRTAFDWGSLCCTYYGTIISVTAGLVVLQNILFRPPPHPRISPGYAGLYSFELPHHAPTFTGSFFLFDFVVIQYVVHLRTKARDYDWRR